MFGSWGVTGMGGSGTGTKPSYRASAFWRIAWRRAPCQRGVLELLLLAKSRPRWREEVGERDEKDADVSDLVGQTW